MYRGSTDNAHNGLSAVVLVVMNFGSVDAHHPRLEQLVEAWQAPVGGNLATSTMRLSDWLIIK